MKSRRLVVFSTGVVLVLTAGIVFAMGILSLPPDAVTVDHGRWNAGDDSTINIELIGVPGGYDVTNRVYPGWCIEDNHQRDYSGPGVNLLDSTDTEELLCPDGDYPGYPWDKINYLLNHQKGSIEDVQVAMWLLTDTYGGSFELTDKAYAMVAKANAKGEGFLPREGEIAAVVLCADGQSDGGYQDTLIEVVVPPRDYQACTPGYWKQKHHFFAWEPTGYTPKENFYGIEFEFNGTEFDYDHVMDMQLIEALWTGGGHEKALYRHATAGLLNAAHPDLAYYYSVEQVIQMVKDAYSSGDFKHYKNMLVEANEMGCPLGNEGPRNPRSRIRRGIGWGH